MHHCMFLPTLAILCQYCGYQFRSLIETQAIALQPRGIARANPVSTQTCPVGWSPVCQQGFIVQLHRGESLLDQTHTGQGALLNILWPHYPSNPALIFYIVSDVCNGISVVIDGSSILYPKACLPLISLPYPFHVVTWRGKELTKQSHFKQAASWLVPVH